MTTYFRRPASPLSACDLLPELNLDCSSENPFFSCNNRPETHFPDISCQDVCLWNRLKLLRLHKVEVLRALKCNVPESQRITACASDFRSSDIVHLYGLPQTLYKISPLFDNIIVKILLLDPVGYIIIPSPPHKAWAQVFLNRLAELLQKNELDSSVHTVLERIIFMRTLNETEYITLCSIFDVVLDPFPVGGGRSSLEIFSTANVIVLQENTTSVLHLTSGMYRAMGIEVSLCCIAQDEDQYVAKSYAIVSNTSYREKLQHQIFNQKNVLYENRSVLSEWEALLKAVSSSPRPELGVCSTMNKEQEKVLSKESCSEKELAPENMHYKNIVKYPYRCEPIVLKSKVLVNIA